MDTKKRQGVRSLRDQLLTLVNGWDPARRLEAGSRRDEYFGLIDGLMAVLSSGAGKDEIAQWLKRELGERFGAEPRDADAFAKKAFTWYEMASREQHR